MTMAKHNYSAVNTARIPCECADPKCPVHYGQSQCVNRAAEILYRVDMEDRTGTAFCQECADDAFDSGMFTVRD